MYRTTKPTLKLYSNWYEALNAKLTPYKGGAALFKKRSKEIMALVKAGRVIESNDSFTIYEIYNKEDREMTEAKKYFFTVGLFVVFELVVLCFLFGYLKCGPAEVIWRLLGRAEF